MTTNVGKLDRLIRATLGVVLLFVAFRGEISTLGTVIAGIAGVVMIGVAVTRVCPVYSLLGIKTCGDA
jgi:hypothetical protein